MKNNIDYITLKISIITIIYLILLIFLSPTIDHLFTTLKDDNDENKSNNIILMEIILHVLTIVIILYFIRKYLDKILEIMLNIKIEGNIKSGKDLVVAITLVGLQKNLLDKLEYITIYHPFRLS